MYFKKTVMFFVFRIIIMSKMFYSTVCCYCNLVQFAIFWLAWMYDECTWYHKTFLVHLATKLYCVIVIIINENNNVEKYTALFHNHCVGHWNCNETTRGKKKQQQKALNIYWAETSERTCLSYCVKITDFHVWKVLNPATAIVSSGPNEIVSKKMIQTAIRDW